MENKTQIIKAENGLSEENPQSFITMAIKQGLSIEHLERLMDLQVRWQANKARMAFLEAMNAFQYSCPALEKTKKVAFGNTKYSYAPLGEIAATIKQSMNDCGLSHRWEMEDKDNMIICTCIISHVAGHSERTTMSAGKDSSGGKNEIQQRGSTITYLQRYSLIAALGISTADEDVDGRIEQNKEKVKAKDKLLVLEPIEKIKECLSILQLTDLWNSMPSEQQKTEQILNAFKEQKNGIL